MAVLPSIGWMALALCILAAVQVLRTRLALEAGAV
jgi:hypothetical protein